MEKRPLGESGVEVSRIGLGCVTFGREVDADRSFQILDYAFEQGVTLLDTAEAYTTGGESGSSERILGAWMRSRGCRSQVAVQTKITSAPTRAQVRESLEGSLERLGVDCVDSLLLHSCAPETPMEEFAAGMSDVCRAGLARAYGCSNCTLEQMWTLLGCCKRGGLERPEVIEPIYNLVRRSAELDLFPFCARRGVGIVTYSPLGAGFLTGKYTRDAAADPPGSRFAVKPGHRRIYCDERGFRLLDRLAGLASATGVAMTRLALGWTLRHPAVASVLVGATRVEHVAAAVKALRDPLPPELIDAVDRLEDLP
jgi:aryl-alcohol dehydrogenase-like predicted oxidoreductase